MKLKLNSKFANQFYVSYLLIIIAKMRRRSGAIHSQTEQQFIKLAEKALNKNGLFYDEKFNKDSEKIQSQMKDKENEANKMNPFSQFDFNQVKEFEKDQRDMHEEAEKQKVMNVKNVVVCDSVEPIVQMLSYETQQKNESRNIDLVVRKLLTQSGKTVVIKYWIIQYSMIESPLAQIYISSASNIFWVSKELCRFMNHQKCQICELTQQIYRYENKLVKQ